VTILNDIATDQQTAKKDETITTEAQRFYDSAIRADRRGEPVKGLLLRNVAFNTQHGAFNTTEYDRWLTTMKQKDKVVLSE
jgi:hypothetical protein